MARYIVSRFAFVSESTVGDDFGIDFYCGLVKDCRDNKEVHFEKPFLLQIKTTTTKPDICYDTPNKIYTLFGLELPFFIAHLDLESARLDIHSTSMMWHAYLLIGMDKIGKVCFTFSNSYYITNLPNTLSNTPKISYSPDGKTKDVKVYLGHPIVSLRLNELETNTTLVEEAREIISKVIDKENANLQNKRLRLNYYRWVYEYETNNSSSFRFGYNFLTMNDGLTNTDPQLAINSMGHYLIALAIAFKEKGDDENYENVCKITRRIESNQHLDNIKDQFPEIYSEPK